MGFIISIFIFSMLLYAMFYLIKITNKILWDANPNLPGGKIVGIIILELFSKRNVEEYFEDTKNFFKDIIQTIKERR